MAKIEPFEAHHERYESWFDRHREAYVSELLAVRAFVPLEGKGLEVGIGSGRFSAPLGVQYGIDPSPAMLNYARSCGMNVAVAIAEQLPFKACVFDYALVVTTICFVDSASDMLAEIHRVLTPEGKLIIGLIDRESELGAFYQKHKAESVFYRDAEFFSAAEVERLLEDNGFTVNARAQTLFRPLPETTEIEPTLPGRGKGAFVVITGKKAGPLGPAKGCESVV
ncbi:class I SAM-dependent methyltransferase [Marinobacter sp.]|uniref:class I SAM-dependent methyltransferase n=1 Tax=Marinobacter sp. TaxID=50741 RepID=UPI003568BE06